MAITTQLIGPLQHFKEKTSPFGEEESAPLPSKQCTGSHVPGIDGQNLTNYFPIQHIRQIIFCFQT